MAVKLQTIKDIRKYIESELAEYYPETEIKGLTGLLFSSVLRISRLKLLSGENEFVAPKNAVKIAQICEELKVYKPVQYLLGETLFYDCTIKVRRGVLIPRPETEELVDLIIKENTGFNGKILDIGTGSGCIAVALAVKLPGSNITAVDISGPALETAEENARLNKVRITLIKADVLKEDLRTTGRSDIIVSNPPYVRNSEKAFMHRNVLDFEPHEALFVPDSDPLLFYRVILEKSVNLLNPGGKIYFEINEAMGSLLLELTCSYGFKDVRIVKDINGKERIIKGTKNA